MASLLANRIRTSKAASYALSDKIKKANDIKYLHRIVKNKLVDGNGYMSCTASAGTLLTPTNLLDYTVRLSYILTNTSHPTITETDEHFANTVISGIIPDTLTPHQLAYYLSTAVRLRSITAINLSSLPLPSFITVSSILHSTVSLRITAELIAGSLRSGVISPQELSYCDEVLNIIECRLRQLLTNEMCYRTLSSLLWSTARLVNHQPAPMSTKSTVDDIFHHSTRLLEYPASTTMLNLRDASEILWAYATSDVEEALALRALTAIDGLLLGDWYHSLTNEKVGNICLLMWSISKISSSYDPIVNRIYDECEQVLSRHLLEAPFIPPESMTMIASSAIRLQRRAVLWPPTLSILQLMSPTQLAAIVRSSAVLGWDSVFHTVVVDCIERESLEGGIELISSLSQVSAAYNTLCVVLDLSKYHFTSAPSDTIIQLISSIVRSGLTKPYLYIIQQSIDVIIPYRVDQLSMTCILDMLRCLTKLTGLYLSPHLLQSLQSLINIFISEPITHRIILIKATASLYPSMATNALNRLSIIPSDRPVLFSALCAGMGYRAIPPPELPQLALQASEVVSELSGVGLAAMTKLFAKHKVRVPALISSLQLSAPVADGYDDTARCLMIVYLQRLGCLSDGVVKSILDDVTSMDGIGLEELVLMVCAIGDEFDHLASVQYAKAAMYKSLNELGECVKDRRQYDGLKRLDPELMSKMLTQLAPLIEQSSHQPDPS